MSSLHPGNKVKAERCCSRASAWAWVEKIAEAALAGDDDCAAILATVINHALGAQPCLQGEDAALLRAWAAHCRPHQSTGCPYCTWERLAT